DRPIVRVVGERVGQAHALVGGRALVDLAGHGHGSRDPSVHALRRDVGAGGRVESGEAEGDGFVHGRIETEVRLLGVLGGADAATAGGEGGEKRERDDCDDRCWTHCTEVYGSVSSPLKNWDGAYPRGDLVKGATATAYRPHPRTPLGAGCASG